MKFSDFVATHAPRHPVSGGFVLGPTPAEAKRPRTLLDLYLDGRADVIFDNTLERPDHYTERQRELAERLVKGTAEDVDASEVDELFLQFNRPSEASKTMRKILRKITAPSEKESGPEEPTRVFEDGPVDPNDLITIV